MYIDYLFIPLMVALKGIVPSIGETTDAEAVKSHSVSACSLSFAFSKSQINGTNSKQTS